MAIPTSQRHYWIFSADPHHYHWDTLFVKGKEMWHGAGSKPDAIRALLAEQVAKPVRFMHEIEAMYAAGFRAFVQLGAGQLGSLIGDILHGEEHLAVSAQSAQRDGLAQLHRVVTGLWADGAEPDERHRRTVVREGLGPARAGVTLHLMPAFGVLLSAIFLHEYPAWFHFVGIALILAGVALSAFKRK